MARNLKVGGVGIPNIDAYPPELHLLTEGLATLQGMGGDSPTEKQQRDIVAVQKAIASRAKLYDYLEQHEGLRPGTKESLSAEAYDSLKGCVVDFTNAAHVLNNLPKDRWKHERIHVKHLGGTVTNKLNAYKGGRGDNIEASIIGVVGEDANGRYVKDRLQQRGITLIDNDVRCEATPLNYVMYEDRDGNKLGDRHILKGRSNALEVLKLNEDNILEAVGKLDRLILEGGEISTAKVGHDLFRKILDKAIEAQIDLAYAPCTSLEARNEHPGNHSVLEKACYYKHNDMPTVLNVDELLANYLPENMRIKLPRGYKIDDFDTDPYFNTATAFLKLELAQREKDMPRTNNQPIAIVSDGERGLFIMTSNKNQMEFVAARNGFEVVDTTGAGDNLTAGAFIKTTQFANEHRNFNIGERQKLTNEQLREIAEFAQDMAVLAITQKGACVDQSRILTLLKSKQNVPVKARFDGVEPVGAERGVNSHAK